MRQGSGRRLVQLGRVFASADGGKRWIRYAPPLGKTPHGIAISASSGGMIVGAEGLVASNKPS